MSYLKARRNLCLQYRKLEDFRRPGEKSISTDILQTRYDFHRSKRLFKLNELWKLREKQRAIEAEKAQIRIE